MGVGPQLVGILSDMLQPLLADDALRYAMLIVSVLVIWAAYHLWIAGRTVEQDLANGSRQVTASDADPSGTLAMVAEAAHNK